MKIRNCTAADIGRICELLAPLWPDIDVNTAEMRRCFERGLQSPNQKYICAVLDDEVVGFCSLNVKNSLWQQGFVGHVDELVVDEPHRRMGIGTALLRRMEEIAAETGCKRLELDSAHHRVEAHAFYESLRFQNRAMLFSKPIVKQEQESRPMAEGPFFPGIITSLPPAELPIAGVSSYLFQGERQQFIFMTFDQDVSVPVHSHEAQWGVVLDGQIELTIGGERRVLRKGDTYYIPKDIPHSARIERGYKDLTLFNQKDRYRPEESQG